VEGCSGGHCVKWWVVAHGRHCGGHCTSDDPLDESKSKLQIFTKEVYCTIIMARNSIDEEDELGAFIYNSSRTAKRFRANEEKSSSSSSQPRRSSRLTKAPDRQTPRAEALHGKKRKTSIPVDKKSNNNRESRKRVPLVCAVSGCTNQAKGRGVCIRHGGGAKRKTCSHEGCTNYAKAGGVCIRHGAKVRTCSHDGCTKNSKKGGVYVRHGAKVNTCSHEGCTNNVQNRGVCIRHGAKVKTCSHNGCTNHPQKGGLCMRHGGTVKTCSHDGCTSHAKIGGVCVRHCV